MAHFTASQKKLFMIVGLTDLAIALVILGVILAGKSNLPVFIPILLLIPAIILTMLGLKK